jgi:predicted PhzF superfamily epimerase YddE/YHI9
MHTKDGCRYRLYQINAFTRSPFSGNSTGVVPAAEGLADRETQAIARELRNPETAFVLPRRDRGGRPLLARTRLFAPETGIPGDPVTGNGNGPLGAHLVLHGIVPHDGSRLHFRSHQGETIRRPGIARVCVDIERGEPVRVRVGGNAVVAFRGQLMLTNSR